MYYKIMAQPNHPFIVVDYKAPEEKRFRDRWDKIITFNDKKTDEPIKLSLQKSAPEKPTKDKKP
jgi:hypothetical protein